jgi:hypothetical protein
MRASVGFGVDGRGGPDGLTWVQIDGPSLVRFSIGGLQFSHGYVAVLDVMMLPPKLMLCLLIHEKRVNRIVGYYPARIDDCEIKPVDIWRIKGSHKVSCSTRHTCAPHNFSFDVLVFSLFKLYLPPCLVYFFPPRRKLAFIEAAVKRIFHQIRRLFGNDFPAVLPTCTSFSAPSTSTSSPAMSAPARRGARRERC